MRPMLDRPHAQVNLIRNTSMFPQKNLDAIKWIIYQWSKTCHQFAIKAGLLRGSFECQRMRKSQTGKGF